MRNTKYQILKRPQATATGERPTWSFVAHGATYNKAGADETCKSLREHGYDTRKLVV